MHMYTRHLLHVWYRVWGTVDAFVSETFSLFRCSRKAVSLVLWWLRSSYARVNEAEIRLDAFPNAQCTPTDWQSAVGDIAD